MAFGNRVPRNPASSWTGKLSSGTAALHNRPQAFHKVITDADIKTGTGGRKLFPKFTASFFKM